MAVTFRCSRGRDRLRLTIARQRKQSVVARRAHRFGRKGNAYLRQPNNCAHAELENLKKQAKQYLRWHRERYYPVAAEIRAALPRFRDLSDAQILEATFKLADAQELVARQRGFAGWQALKSEQMP